MNKKIKNKNKNMYVRGEITKQNAKHFLQRNFENF